MIILFCINFKKSIQSDGRGSVNSFGKAFYEIEKPAAISLYRTY